MKIVLTNDDGFNSEGINILFDHLRSIGHECLIIAPDKDNSAISHSITLGRTIEIIRISNDIYSVSGTPADCIMLSHKIGLLNNASLIISGINRGGNMGEDVHYSGTVAASLESGFYGFGSIAISINSKTPENYSSILPFIKEIINLCLKMSSKSILNVNYPDLKELKGLVWTTLGKREYIDHIEFSENEYGYSILNKPSSNVPELLKGTDYWALESGYVSITPLILDWTDNEYLKGINE